MKYEITNKSTGTHQPVGVATSPADAARWVAALMPGGLGNEHVARNRAAIVSAAGNLGDNEYVEVTLGIPGEHVIVGIHSRPDDFGTSRTTPGTRSISVELDLEPMFLADVLTVACESGINYWAYLTQTTRSDAWPHIVVVAWLKDQDTELLHRVDATTIARGIRAALSAGFKIRADIRSAIFAGTVLNDAGEIDSEAADVIVQAALFGQIIYS